MKISLVVCFKDSTSGLASYFEFFWWFLTSKSTINPSRVASSHVIHMLETLKFLTKSHYYLSFSFADLVNLANQFQHLKSYRVKKINASAKASTTTIASLHKQVNNLQFISILLLDLHWDIKVATLRNSFSFSSYHYYTIFLL